MIRVIRVICEICGLKDGGNQLQPYRRHLYQLLANEMRTPHWKVSAGYGMLQLLVGMSVLILKPFGSIMVLLLLAACFGGKK